MAQGAGTVIKLNQRLDVRKLGDIGELIQHSAFSRLTKIIQTRLDETPDPATARQSGHDRDGDLLFDRRHATIVVHGSRGSGKTTFVRNAFSWYREHPDYKENIGGKVCFLGVLDPTLIESKENVFVILINKIRMAVEQMRPRREWEMPGHDSSNEYEAWKQKLKALAAGLTSLPGVGAERTLGDNWEDPQYVLRKGLDKAEAGMSLEERFHEFVRSSLTFLGKKAFLLALDDIDTDFRRGWPVLEVMRRYLTSPHLITVLSGDMDLYSMLVRGIQWEHFPERQLEYDKQLRPAILEMIDHLQSQYLLKLLAQESRINLRPLADIDDVEVVSTGREQERLSDFMARMVGDGFGFGGLDKRRAADLIMRQPMRTALSVMKAYDSGELASELPSVFIDVLTRHNTDLDGLRHAVGRRLPLYISQFLTKNELWESAHNLLPDHASDDLNLALLTVSTWAREQFGRDPGVALAYMLRVCFTHELLTTRLQGLMHGSAADFMKTFIDFTELDRDGSLVELARRFVAIIQGSSVTPIALGTAHTYRRAPLDPIAAMYNSSIATPTQFNFATVEPPKASPIHGFYSRIREAFGQHDMLERPTFLQGNFYNTVDSLTQRLISPTMAAFAALPACRIMSPTAGQSTFISVHNLVGFVAELLHVGASGRDAVIALIKSTSAIRSYPVPPWVFAGVPGGITTEVEVEDDVDGIAPEEPGLSYIEELEHHPLVKALVDWATDQTAERMFAPGLLARVWARFYFSLAAVDENIRDHPDQRFLGTLLNRQIVLFLNALLAEEAAQNDSKVQTRNPTGSDRIFFINLEYWRDAPFTQKIATCPLWSIYVDHDSSFGEFVTEAGGVDPDWLDVEYEVTQISRHIALSEQGSAEQGAQRKIVTFLGLYDLYNSIAIPGLWRSKNEKGGRIRRIPRPLAEAASPIREKV